MKKKQTKMSTQTHVTTKYNVYSNKKSMTLFKGPTDQHISERRKEKDVVRITV